MMFRSLAKVFPQYVAYVYDFVDQLHLNSWAITKTKKNSIMNALKCRTLATKMLL